MVEEDQCEDEEAIRREALHTASLEEEDSALRVVECVALRHRVGRVDEEAPCVVDLVAWALALRDEVLLPQATTTTTRVLTVRALRHASSHPMVRATGTCHHSLLWQSDKLLRWMLVPGRRLKIKTRTRTATTV